MKQPFQDYYKVLQVPPEASKEVIRAAYKRLSKIYHPDVNQDRNAQEMMSQINVAFSVLGDEKKRREYHELWEQRMGFGGGRNRNTRNSHNTGFCSGATANPGGYQRSTYQGRTDSGAADWRSRNNSKGYQSAYSNGKTDGRTYSRGNGAYQSNTAYSGAGSRGGYGTATDNQGRGGYAQGTDGQNWNGYASGNGNARDTQGSYQNSGYRGNQACTGPADQRHPAFQTIEHYFKCLRKHQWNEAYQQLTNGDREHATQAEFAEWQNTVIRCYEMIRYQIKYYKTYRNCKLDDVIYDTIIEYSVAVTDSDVRTLESSTETLHKYVAFNGYSWRVCLGMSSLKQSILRFRLLAEKKGNFDPMDLYHNAVRRRDTLTSLFSESGFYEDAEKEEYRYQRYHRPFSLLVFHIRCENPDREPFCLCHCANVLSRNLRKTDIPARLENNRLICLLAETPLAGAQKALVKFMALISRSQTEPYQVSTGLVAYQGYANLKDAVYAACSEANFTKNELVFSQYE